MVLSDLTLQPEPIQSSKTLIAGKTRLAKYYIPLDDSGKRGVEYDVHRLIASRDPKHTNFVEVRYASTCTFSIYSQ